MKNLGKKAVIAAAVFGLLSGTVPTPPTAAAKDSYWLYGISKAAGGKMTMYYKGNIISIKGKIRKAASRKKVGDAVERACSYSLKVADNCKVDSLETTSVQTVTYKKWKKEKLEQMRHHHNRHPFFIKCPQNPLRNLCPFFFRRTGKGFIQQKKYSQVLPPAPSHSSS